MGGGAGDSVEEKGSPIMRRPRFEVRAGRSLGIDEPPRGVKRTTGLRDDDDDDNVIPSFGRTFATRRFSGRE